MHSTEEILNNYTYKNPVTVLVTIEWVCVNKATSLLISCLFEEAVKLLLDLQAFGKPVKHSEQV